MTERTKLVKAVINLLYSAAEDAARTGGFDQRTRVYKIHLTEECLDQLVRLDLELDRLQNDSPPAIKHAACQRCGSQKIQLDLCNHKAVCQICGMVVK